MPDYNNGKIYCIRSPNTDLIYIGSTCQKLSQRMCGHRRDNKTKLKESSSKIIFDYGDAYIELLENYSCDNKEQLLKKEGEYIRNNNCCNKRIESRTKKEYREDNKNKLNEYYKEYHKINKNKMNERAKEYYEVNKNKMNEQMKEYYEINKEQITEYKKQWYEVNKEQINEYKKQWYEDNKKRILQQRKEYYRLNNK